MTRLIDSLGLAKSIINKPILNPEVAAFLKKEKRLQRIISGVTILLLFFFTIFIEFYHSSLKRFRGWTLFLGG